MGRVTALSSLRAGAQVMMLDADAQSLERRANEACESRREPHAVMGGGVV